jgi:uncharacterized protein (TIGR03435 family)
MSRTALLFAGAGMLALIAPMSAQTAAPKFDVASVKPNASGNPPYSNIPIGPGDVYVRNGGYFNATGFPLITYIAFAYKMIGNQAQYLIPQLPAWATTDRYDIQARAESDPGKDQMRLMMRSLLADRFQLAIRYEEREVPVFAFVLAATGKLGPQLRPHTETPPCSTDQAPGAAPAIEGGLPVLCNGIYPLKPTAPGRLRFGARNVTIGFIADTFSAGTNLGRPMVDRTGLDGKLDFTLEFVQERRDPAASPTDAPPEPAGPSFQEALREQLGIRLQPQKAPMRVPVVDHVERPSAN